MFTGYYLNAADIYGLLYNKEADVETDWEI
jgi:hypothetical protein